MPREPRSLRTGLCHQQILDEECNQGNEKVEMAKTSIFSKILGMSDAFHSISNGFKGTAGR